MINAKVGWQLELFFFCFTYLMMMMIRACRLLRIILFAGLCGSVRCGRMLGIQVLYMLIYVSYAQYNP